MLERAQWSDTARGNQLDARQAAPRVGQAPARGGQVGARRDQAGVTV